MGRDSGLIDSKRIQPGQVVIVKRGGIVDEICFPAGGAVVIIDPAKSIDRCEKCGKRVGSE